MDKLKGKTAVVTGASTGIGLAIAKLFVEEGAYVFITGRREKELAEAEAAIGRNVTAVPGDVASLADLDRLYKAVATHGKLDIVVANAGVPGGSMLESVTEDQYQRLFDVNVKGVLFTVQKALPVLNDGGSIILIGSASGSKGTPGVGIYGASKAAIRNFVRSWTLELKDRQIRSNVLSPGLIATAIFDSVPEEVVERLLSMVPVGRMGRVQEVAKAALFLASDDSSFVSGVELFVDGGRAQV